MQVRVLPGSPKIRNRCYHPCQPIFGDSLVKAFTTSRPERYSLPIFPLARLSASRDVGLSVFFECCFIGLREKKALNEFHGHRTFFVIVGRVVDSIAYGMAAHELSVVWLQYVGYRVCIPHAWIKPQIVIVPIKYDWHSVVNGTGHSVGSCRQNRTRLQEPAGRIFPSFPDPRKCEQLTFIDLKAVRLFFLSKPLPLIKPICGNQASAKFQRIAECRLRRRRFRSRVYHASAYGRVFCPPGNKAPTR